MKGIHIKKRMMILLSIVILFFTLNVVDAASFKDVNHTSWYYNDLVMLTGKNIISGFSDGTFRPTDLITQDQFIKLIITTLGKTDITNASGYWAREYINEAILQDIIKPETPFNYDGYKMQITRAEMAQIVVNALNESYGDLSTYKEKIKDFDQIPSKYQDAVLKVYSKEIIMGYKDGEFKPENILTRAEVTAVLSRILNKTRIKDIKVLTSAEENRLKNYTKNAKLPYNRGTDKFVDFGTAITKIKSYNVDFKKTAKMYLENFIYGVNFEQLKNDTRMLDEVYKTVCGIYDVYDGGTNLKYNQYIDKKIAEDIKEKNITLARFETNENLMYISKDETIRIRGVLLYKYISTIKEGMQTEKLYKENIEIEITLNSLRQPIVVQYFVLGGN